MNEPPKKYRHRSQEPPGQAQDDAEDKEEEFEVEFEEEDDDDDAELGGMNFIG